jgi:hypothetical protein
MRTPEENAAVTASKLASVMRGISFRGRGFSDRTIQALLDHGIDFPEPLLFMEPSQLKQIPGIGKTSFAEIMRYRKRFGR